MQAAKGGTLTNPRALTLWVLLLVVVLSGCQSAQSTQSPAEPDAGDQWWDADSSPADEQALRERVRGMVDDIRQRRGDYRLGPEDKLRLIVWNRPDLSKDTRIRPDGKLFVMHVGTVDAAGLTVGELQKLLTERLGEVLRNPQVDVEILEYASKVYYVMGQVNKPGMYAVTATTNVLEGVAVSGGPTDKANLGGAYLIRHGNVVPIDFYALFQQGDVSQNVFLADGDIIYLPSMDDAKIYVLGEVNQARAVPLRKARLTLGEAIAEAGGFNETTAYKRAIKIIRGNLANPRVYTVNYDEVLRGMKPDVAFLQSGDIVFVPAAGLTKWDRVLSQLLPNLSRIVVDAASINSLMDR